MRYSYALPNTSGGTAALVSALLEKCSMRSASLRSGSLSLLVQLALPKMPYSVSGFAFSISRNAVCKAVPMFAVLVRTSSQRLPGGIAKRWFSANRANSRSEERRVGKGGGGGRRSDED